MGNILFIAPTLRTRVFDHRYQLIRAFFGEEKITMQIDRSLGTAVGEPELAFFPEGKFLRTRLPNGRALKPDGKPGFTRVSAVVCFEERLVERFPHPNPLELIDAGRGSFAWENWDRALELHYSVRNRTWIDHDVLVLHNPIAPYKMSPALWHGCAQLVEQGGGMGWNDGRALRP
jgi:hypothetical protein